MGDRLNIPSVGGGDIWSGILSSGPVTEDVIIRVIKHASLNPGVGVSWTIHQHGCILYYSIVMLYVYCVLLYIYCEHNVRSNI